MEEWEVTVLASEYYAALQEEVEDCWRFFRPCIWINRYFTRLRVLVEGAAEVATAASEADDGCVLRGAVVGGEVRSGGVCRHHHIGLVWQSGGNTVICFRMTAQTEGMAYSVVGGGVICRWRRTLSVLEAEAKRGVGTNCEEVYQIEDT